jgi:hypothetical protein
LPERQLALGLVAEEITRGDFLLAKLLGPVRCDARALLGLRRMFRLAGGISFLALLLGEGLNLPLQFVAGLAFGDGAMARCSIRPPRLRIFLIAATGSPAAALFNIEKDRA